MTSIETVKPYLCIARINDKEMLFYDRYRFCFEATAQEDPELGKLRKSGSLVYVRYKVDTTELIMISQDLNLWVYKFAHSKFTVKKLPLPSTLSAKLVLPKIEFGIVNVMKQGKPKFEALNNSDEGFDVDWQEASQSILFSNGREPYLYIQEGSGYREVALLKSTRGFLSGLVASFERDCLRVQSVRVEDSRMPGLQKMVLDTQKTSLSDDGLLS